MRRQQRVRADGESSWEGKGRGGEELVRARSSSGGNGPRSEQMHWHICYTGSSSLWFHCDFIFLGVAGGERRCGGRRWVTSANQLDALNRFICWSWSRTMAMAKNNSPLCRSRVCMGLWRHRGDSWDQMAPWTGGRVLLAIYMYGERNQGGQTAFHSIKRPWGWGRGCFLLTDESQGMVIMFASYYLVPEEEVCIQLILTQLAILSLKSINWINQVFIFFNGIKLSELASCVSVWMYLSCHL